MSAGDSRQISRRSGTLSRLALRAQTDARLVSLAREGHDVAFEEIVRRYRTPLVRFASTIVPADAAEDTVQDALIRAHGAMLAGDSELALRAWLYTIVRNGAVSDRRKIRPSEELDETINGVPQPPDIIERSERVRGVVAKLKELPDAQREALVRTEMGGQSADQIAADLSTTPAAVGQLVFRARSALRGAAAMLLPMPVMRMVLELGAGRSGATAGSILAGAGAVAGGGGGGATVVKVGVAAVIAALAVAPGGPRESELDLEQPPAVEAGSPSEGSAGANQAHHEAAAEASHTGATEHLASGDSAGSRQANPAGDGGGEEGSGDAQRGAESVSVELTSVASGDTGGGSGSDAPQGGGGHNGDDQPPPPPDDDGGDQQYDTKPPPPPSGGNGDSWDGDGGGYHRPHDGGDQYSHPSGDDGYGGGGDHHDGGGGHGGHH